MAAKTTSTTRGNLILAAGAIVALGAMVAGCQTNYALMYDQEAHAQRVAAWCRAYSGVTPASPLGQDCIRRAWVGVPPGKCVYGCIDQFTAFYPKAYHRVHHPARRGPIYK